MSKGDELEVHSGKEVVLEQPVPVAVVDTAAEAAPVVAPVAARAAAAAAACHFQWGA